MPRKVTMICAIVALLVAAAPARAQDDACMGRGGALDSETGLCHASTGMSVDIDFPVSLTDYPFAQAAVDDFITGRYRQFVQSFAETELQFTASFPWSLNISYDEYAFSDSVRSVVFTVGEYTGGVHPNSWYVTYSFDLAGERVLTLDDLFVNTGSALTAIAPVTRAQLETALGDMALPDILNPGTEPTAENYANFALTPDSLLFLFPPYQVAPYAAGPQGVTLPLADLTALLKPEFLPG